VILKTGFGWFLKCGIPHRCRAELFCVQKVNSFSELAFLYPGDTNVSPCC